MEKVKTFVGAKLRQMSNIGKCQYKFICHLVEVLLSLRGRVTYLNLARYGKYSEQSYRLHFGKLFDFKAFNSLLIDEVAGKELLWLFDPTYITKSGKHTPGVGYFWSGCAQAVKWGLELGGLAIGDVEHHTALHYHATQTGVEKDKDESLLAYYANILIQQAAAMQKIAKIVVVDAFFSKQSFVSPVCAAGFTVITRLQKNAFLRYAYTGEHRQGRGRPKQFDGKIDPTNISLDHFTLDFKDATKCVYSGKAQVRGLKAWGKVVIVHFFKDDGSLKNYCIYFSSDETMDGLKVYEYYRMRFQIEFLYRDAKGHLGLEDCQSRQAEALHFHYNMVLTTLNIVKALHWYTQPKEQRLPFSIADIKTQYSNRFILDKIISIYGKDPKVEINNPQIRKLYLLGSIAA